MEQRRSRRWLYLLLMVTVALGIGIVLEKGLERTGHASETYEELRTFSEVLTQVQKHYVDDTKVKTSYRVRFAGCSPRWIRTRPI